MTNLLTVSILLPDSLKWFNNKSQIVGTPREIVTFSAFMRSVMLSPSNLAPGKTILVPHIGAA